MHCLRIFLYGAALIFAAGLSFGVAPVFAGDVPEIVSPAPPDPGIVEPSPPPTGEGAAGLPEAPSPFPLLITPAHSVKNQHEHFHWRAALEETFEFDTIMHLKRLSDVDTGPELKGVLFTDYIHSVEGLHGWDDHEPFMVEYVQHSFQGATD